MRDSSKQVWIARLLALLVMSFGFSFLMRIAPESKEVFKKRIEIKANENVGEIVNAVEKLARDDIYIQIKDEYWAAQKSKFLWRWIALFATLGILLGIYYIIYCIVHSLLNRKERDDRLTTYDEL